MPKPAGLIPDCSGENALELPGLEEECGEGEECSPQEDESWAEPVLLLLCCLNSSAPMRP